MQRTSTNRSFRLKVASAVGGGALFIWAAMPGAAWAARSYQFTGQVTDVGHDTIAVSRGAETLEFRRDARGLRGVKVGDQITVHYQLDADRVQPAAPSRQQPGQASPSNAPVDAPKNAPVIDDRAFYDARLTAPAMKFLRKAG